MNSKMVLWTTLAVSGLLLPASANAQQTYNYSYSYAHIRHVEGDFQIQRATELEPSEATLNHPVLSGDRVWTRAYARAEIQFGDGTLLRMDERTRVDFADFGENGGETLIRQWSGSLIIRLSEDKGGSFRLDTPAGTIYPASAGLFRIDVYDGGASTVLSVYEGVAELASEGGSVLVRSGQRSIIEPSRRPEPSFAFNTTQWDEFASWSDERDREYTTTENIEGIPRDVDVYAGQLEHHGTWRVDVGLGPVWYPSVSVGWYPYSQGYWSYTNFGYTWVSSEPWGWAPYHYGRWGNNHHGWYWIPGAHWGPAWVSWAIGPSWVGWSPLGYYDRPVHYHHGFRSRGGKAVPRGSIVARTRGDGWNFVESDHFGRRSRGKARLRSADIQATAHRAKVFESGAILDRNLRPSVVGAAAMTRLPKGGLAELRSRNGSGGELATRRGVTKRGGNLTGNRVVEQSGRIQAGRARSRAQPSLSSSGKGRGSGNSNLQKGSPLSSSARSRSSSRSTISNRKPGDSSTSQGKPLGTRGGAIKRRNVPRKSGDQASTLTKGRSRTSRQPSGRTSSPSTTNRSSSGQSTGRIIRSQPRPNQPKPSSPGSFSDRSRSSRGTSSSSQKSNPSSRGERSLRSEVPRSSGRVRTGESRSRPSQTPPSSSNRVKRPENRSGGSVRGRSIYDRVTRSRPKTNRPSSPSRSRPSARPSRSRPRSVSPPSRPSSPPQSSSSSGRARSTRKPKKKNQ